MFDILAMGPDSGPLHDALGRAEFRHDATRPQPKLRLEDTQQML